MEKRNKRSRKQKQAENKNQKRKKKKPKKKTKETKKLKRKTKSTGKKTIQKRTPKKKKSRKFCADVCWNRYVGHFKPSLMEVVFLWANGATFLEVTQATTIFEGSIIRAMRRLEELLRQLVSAAKSIGNSELENKFALSISCIKRDIVFASSLYL